jgi:hypothetical protein
MSKRYVVFSNREGSKAELLEFKSPGDDEKTTPTSYLYPIGVVYDHGKGELNDLVGKPISGNPEISDLVGQVLTVVDAMISDKEQREAFKSLMRQTLYGYANDKEKEVCQVYQGLIHKSNKV